MVKCEYSGHWVHGDEIVDWIDCMDICRACYYSLSGEEQDLLCSGIPVYNDEDEDEDYNEDEDEDEDEDY